MLSFVVSLLQFTNFASAQDTKKAPEKAQGSLWSVNCTNPGKAFQCKLTQRIVLRKTRQLLLAVTVQKSGKPKKPSMMIQLPHGLFLPAGIKIQIDKNKLLQRPIQTCDSKGCYVGLPLADNQIKLLKQGRKLKIEFQNLKKKAITVPLPLRGFEAAYKKL